MESKRINKIVGHVSSTSKPAASLNSTETSGNFFDQPHLKVSQESAMLSAERAKASFNVSSLNQLMTGENADVVEQVYKFMEEDPLFRIDLRRFEDHKEHRKWVLQVIKKVAASGFVSIEKLQENPMRFGDAYNTFSLIDGSVAVKLGVHIGLWGGSIVNLGSEKQQQALLPDTDKANIIGCFCLTELKHGSNAQGIETIATYDQTTQEFIITTPHEGAMKWWIGAAANDATYGVVFAQLHMKGTNHGVHGFVVQLRNKKDKSLMPGVHIGDCGLKVGLNGVDNGFLLFDNVRVPRENILAKFAHVDEKGEYQSPIKSNTKRFVMMMSALMTGRVSIIFSSTNNLKLVLTIAIRYAAVRKQFGPSKDHEISVLNYQTHQTTLMPLLSYCYALDVVKRAVAVLLIDKKIINEGSEDELAELHMLSAGLKAVASTVAQNACNTARALCGGHGYAAVSRIGHIRNDNDVQQTYEGDNTVMLQQVAIVLLKTFQKEFGGGGIFGTLKYVGKGIESFLQSSNPFSVYTGDESYLKGARFQVDALKYRAASLLNSLALRLRHRTTTLKKPYFEAWNECLEHVVHLSRAHMEYFILQTFVQFIQKVKDPQQKAVLNKLRSCFALHCITSDINFFYSICSKIKLRAMNRAFVSLCAELREQAVPLVDAFGIPDFVLASPLGHSDGNVYEHYVKAAKANRPGF